MTTSPLRDAVEQASGLSHGSLTPGLDRGQDDCELEQRTGPDAEYGALQRPADGDQGLVEEIEQFHDVERDAEVDEKQLRQLVSTDDALQ